MERGGTLGETGNYTEDETFRLSSGSMFYLNVAVNIVSNKLALLT